MTRWSGSILAQQRRHLVTVSGVQVRRPTASVALGRHGQACRPSTTRRYMTCRLPRNLPSGLCVRRRQFSTEQATDEEDRLRAFLP